MGILKLHYICNRYMRGTLAQLVEQRTENPCVPGSIPGGTTTKKPLTSADVKGFLILFRWSDLQKRKHNFVDHMHDTIVGLNICHNDICNTAIFVDELWPIS